MRTTLTLDPDVAAALDRRRRATERTLREEVNELLRLGLLHADTSPEPGPAFRTTSHDAGRLLVGSLDDVATALAAAEGEQFK